MAGAFERFERVLPEGPGGDVRWLYRCWKRIDALWWKISADRDTDDDCQASSLKRNNRYGNNDELWI